MCKLAVKESTQEDWIFVSDHESNPPNFLRTLWRLGLSFFSVSKYIITNISEVQSILDKNIDKSSPVHVMFLCGMYEIYIYPQNTQNNTGADVVIGSGLYDALQLQDAAPQEPTVVAVGREGFTQQLLVQLKDSSSVIVVPEDVQVIR